MPDQATLPAGRAALLTTAFVAAICGWGFSQVVPPPAVPSTAPASQFSAGRALGYLRAFAGEPHPVGSEAHSQVRHYILQQLTLLGVDPQEQVATVVSSRWGSPYAAATVHNIMARLPGTGSTRAVMLSGHYDSVSAGPGASDDGHAVALELETLRALRPGPRLRNDVIFLFTDSEEGGLLGAKAFLDQHPWAKKVGLVLNFEARGTSGPGMMFETSEGNGKLIREFAAAAPHPVTSSLSYEAYKLLPNDTDLTFYKQAGLAGLGFAYVGDVIYYHTQYDDLAHLDPRSLQQEGDYALALARRFGNLDLGDLKSSDATYFVLPFFGCVVYPVGWSIPLALLCAILFAAVMALGISRHRLSLGGTLAGFLQFLLAAAGATAAVWALWSLTRGEGSGFWQAFAGDPYHPGVYRIASVALALCLTSAFYAVFRRKAGLLDLWAGAMVVWLILAIATGLFMPGATYLFVWPVLASTLALGILVAAGLEVGNRSGSPFTGVLVLWLFAVPGLIMMTPTIQLLFQSLTMRLAPVAALATMLLLGLLIPCLRVVAAPGKWWLPGIAALVCAAFVVAGASMSGFDREEPRTNSIYYGLDADTGHAVWFSLDGQEDDWTSHYLGANPLRAALPQYVPFLSWQYLTHEAPAVPLPPPQIERLEDSQDSTSRSLLLRVTSPRQAPRIYLYGDERTDVLAASVNGVPVDASKAYAGLKPGQKAYAYRMRRWGLSYLNVPREGIELRIRLKGPAHAWRLEAVDQSYGISGLPGVVPRPDTMIPMPLMMDSVWVRKLFLF